jgi:hypothetical protein
VWLLSKAQAPRSVSRIGLPRSHIIARWVDDVPNPSFPQLKGPPSIPHPAEGVIDCRHAGLGMVQNLRKDDTVDAAFITAAADTSSEATQLPTS